jgi:hypothetical protein
MSVRVQFREDEDAIAFLEGMGLNPNEVAKSAFDARVRKLRAEAKMARLTGIRRTPVPGGYAKAVREDRDAR